MPSAYIANVCLQILTSKPTSDLVSILIIYSGFHVDQKPCYNWEVGEPLLFFSRSGSPVSQTKLEFAVWPKLTLKSSCHCCHHHPGSVGITNVGHCAYFFFCTGGWTQGFLNAKEALSQQNMGCLNQSLLSHLFLMANCQKFRASSGIIHLGQKMVSSSNVCVHKVMARMINLSTIVVNFFLSCTLCFLESTELVPVSWNLVHSSACFDHASRMWWCEQVPFRAEPFKAHVFPSGSLLWFCKMAGNIDSQNVLWLTV